MATYKTAPLVDYDISFRDVAERLFHLAENRLRRGVGVPEKGSYSFRPTNRSQETVVKILIYQRAFGVEMQGELPWGSDGVYVLVRTNGQFGDLLWEDLPSVDARFRDRISRDENVGTAPNYDSRFAYFPVMAGESLDAIAEFIASQVERASV
jgi:hypothetical protein